MVDLVYLDFTKAFNFAGLRLLKSFSIDENVLNWIKLDLSGRYAFFLMGLPVNVAYSKCDLLITVTVLYITDLHATLSDSAFLFANEVCVPSASVKLGAFLPFFRLGLANQMVFTSKPQQWLKPHFWEHSSLSSVFFNC